MRRLQLTTYQFQGTIDVYLISTGGKAMLHTGIWRLSNFGYPQFVSWGGGVTAVRLQLVSCRFLTAVIHPLPGTLQTLKNFSFEVG